MHLFPHAATLRRSVRSVGVGYVLLTQRHGVLHSLQQIPTLFSNLCQKGATPQRTNTAFSLLSRKAKHWNSELQPSSAIGEMLEHIRAFKRHLDYNCCATRTISLFCVRMALSTAKCRPITGAWRCTVCCNRHIIIVLTTSAWIVPLTFLRANMQLKCCSSISEGMVSRVVGSWEGSRKLVQEEKEVCKRRCTGKLKE